MKKLSIFPLLLTLLGLAACSAQPQPVAVDADQVAPVAEVSAISGTTVVEASAGASTLEASLTYMREEEKLAHDVYVFLYDRWGVQIFQNIAESEQTHADMVKSLLETYGLADPAANLGAGQFVNPDLQALYDRLTAQGSQSLAEALKVGAAIEEIDILDLQARLQSDLPDDVRFVFENLLSGSFNHLAAFTSTLERQTGEIYQPQYLTPEAYADALNQASAGGNGYHGGRP